MRGFGRGASEIGPSGTGPEPKTDRPELDWSDIREAEASHHGSWIKDQGSWIKDHGSWIMGHGSRIKDQGSWALDLGPCSGMNAHPRSDTDVISRPSKSTIKDLSFHIGFTRIGSRIKDLIKDLGPCFGTNGHFRRDPDVISRLPGSTLDFVFLQALEA